jgi:glutaminyl-peptide cyclotransferase
MNSVTVSDSGSETQPVDSRYSSYDSSPKASSKKNRSTKGPGVTPPPPYRLRLLKYILFGMLGATIGTIGTAYWVVQDRLEAEAANSPTVVPPKYKALSYLVKVCDFGPRPSGSPAMAAQQDYLKSFFQSQGATVQRQTFEVRHPETGEPTPITNLIASWGVDRPNRYLLCAHYDTRPYPDQDRKNRKGVFVGANDGASGVAALMELSHHLADLPDQVGVDIVLFDGEELVYQQGRDDYFLGSTYFANQYVSDPPKIPYRSGVLLDMIGDRELKIYYESNSLEMAPQVVKEVWGVARRLKVNEFVPRVRHTISDDHLPLNRTAKIPTIDLIDFDYPRPGLAAPAYWHTEQDIPENCSGQSLATVVWVVHEWLKSK